jgi:hypothetical protein
MLHKRSDKNSHLDTILYEIDMLRHCAKAVPTTKARSSESDHAQAEYNLAIEGFLIHLRNLLGFFTTLHSLPTDLALNRPEVWAGRSVDSREYSDLIDVAKAFNDHYSETWNQKKLDCYDLISKFLQHCTPARYEHAMWWDIEKMAAEIESVLAAFEKRFAPVTVPVIGIGMASCSTATMRIGSVILEKK